MSVNVCVFADDWGVLDHLSLEVLELANCGLSGPLPWPNYYLNGGVNSNDTTGSPLRVLHLQGNALTGSVPMAWASLPRLACLQLHINPGLCGDVPDGLPCFHTTGTNLGAQPGAQGVATACPMPCSALPLCLQVFQILMRHHARCGCCCVACRALGCRMPLDKHNVHQRSQQCHLPPTSPGLLPSAGCSWRAGPCPV